jgi:exosortase/archaeosortase family protein
MEGAARYLRAERFEIPQLAIAGGLALALLAAFGASYRVLLPLAGSDSPLGVVLVAPLVAVAILVVKLPHVQRNSEEILANVALSLPLLFAVGFLLVWAPAKLSYFYWEYRFDLLAVPAFVGLLLVLLYGLPALWSTREALIVLAFGWPPLADWFARIFAQPLADLDTRIVHLAVHPLFPDIVRNGDLLVFSRDGQKQAVAIAGTCSGLAGVLAIGLLGAGVLSVVHGPARRKRVWFATALGLVLLANLVRLWAVVVVARLEGLGPAATTFHNTAGPLVAAAVCFGMLLLLRPFGLELRLPSLRGLAPAEVRRPTALTLAGAALALTVATGAATAGLSFRDIGLYAGAQRITRNDPLPAPTGYRATHVADIPSVAATFGGDTDAKLYFMRGPRGEGFMAQVVVTRTRAEAKAYGVLQCFAYHKLKIYDAKESPLADGGTAQVIDIRVGKDDIATAAWLQPVILGDHAAWRRTILYQYLPGLGRGAAKGASTGVMRSFGLWLVNTLSPYGGIEAPARFGRAEADVLRWAEDYTASRAVPSIAQPGAPAGVLQPG